jgi:hypothetical protein
LALPVRVPENIGEPSLWSNLSFNSRRGPDGCCTRRSSNASVDPPQAGEYGRRLGAAGHGEHQAYDGLAVAGESAGLAVPVSLSELV